MFQLSATPAPKSTIKGGIEARLVAGPIEARLPALRTECLKDATLKRIPRLHLLIDYDGSIQNAGLYGRIPRRAQRRCLIAKMKTWDFPPPDNGHRTWVIYPLLKETAKSTGSRAKARR